jgi:metal transporter CNNM
MIWIFAPIAYPIAWLLDWILGHKQGMIYRHAELRELVTLHGEDQSGPLTKDEVSVLKAVLDLRHKTVSDIMTKLDDVFMLPSTGVLNRTTLKSILRAGHSRIPIYAPKNRKNIVGVLLVKQLLLNETTGEDTRFDSLDLRPLPKVIPSLPLFDMLVT